MTVSSTNSRDLATGNGTVGPFSFTFTLQQATDMNVYVSGAVISSGLYTITPNGGSYPCVGGSISWNLLANAPATGVPLVFASAVSYTQPLSLPIETDFPEKSLENALDRNTLQIQQLKLLNDLSLHFAVTENVSATLSGQQALYLPRMNAANNALEFVSAAQIANEVTAGNGNVVGPASSVLNRPALFADATGKLLKEAPYTMPATAGATGEFLKFSGGNIIASSLGLNPLVSSQITSSLRPLPAGAATLSGDYIHFGDWVQGGNLVITHGTRVFCKGKLGWGNGFTITITPQTNGGAGHLGYGADGGGLAGGSGGIYQGGGGAGGSCAGAGGTGGQGTAGQVNTTRAVYTTWGMGGSGGGGGSGNGTSPNIGAIGGDGGIFWYCEATDTVTYGTNIANNGTNGATGVLTNNGAGGGGAGGQHSSRSATAIIVSNGVTLSNNGGNGGATNGTGIKGGGGGGGQGELWAPIITITGATLQNNGGTKGSGSAPSSDAADGSAGAAWNQIIGSPISLFR